jgi:hypothetical protein
MDRVLFEIVFTISAACAVGTFAALLAWQAIAAVGRAVFRSSRASQRPLGLRLPTCPQHLRNDEVRRVGNWNWYPRSNPSPAPPPPPPPPPPPEWAR